MKPTQLYFLCIYTLSTYLSIIIDSKEKRFRTSDQARTSCFPVRPVRVGRTAAGCTAGSGSGSQVHSTTAAPHCVGVEHDIVWDLIEKDPVALDNSSSVDSVKLVDIRILVVLIDGFVARWRHAVDGHAVKTIDSHGETVDGANGVVHALLEDIAGSTTAVLTTAGHTGGADGATRDSSSSSGSFGSDGATYGDRSQDWSRSRLD